MEAINNFCSSRFLESSTSLRMPATLFTFPGDLFTPVSCIATGCLNGPILSYHSTMRRRCDRVESAALPSIVCKEHYLTWLYGTTLMRMLLQQINRF